MTEEELKFKLNQFIFHPMTEQTLLEIKHCIEEALGTRAHIQVTGDNSIKINDDVIDPEFLEDLTHMDDVIDGEFDVHREMSGREEELYNSLDSAFAGDDNNEIDKILDELEELENKGLEANGCFDYCGEADTPPEESIWEGV